MRKRKAAVIVLLVCILTLLNGCGLLPFSEDNPLEKDENQKVPEFQSKPRQEEEQETEASAEEAEISEEEDDGVLKEAERMAMQYDYTGAIELLRSQPEYETDSRMQEAVTEYENERAGCVEYPLEEVTHVFFHTLVKDVDKAFDGDSDEAGYNQVMTTIDEFNKIIESMYEKGFVMVSVHDMAVVNEDGTMSRGKIMLPPDKKPFVLSQDDVSYYHYMDGDGFASKLVIDENGDIKNEYIEEDGSISVGDYDMVPLIETFVKEHPDFSYQGRKGLLAMTGYNGVLGYRTDIAYKTGENLDELQQKFLDENPDFDYEAEVAAEKEVADAMKEKGWEFGSHTWGHKNASSDSAETLQADNEKWEAYVAPILGKTDVIVFAFGADIGGWENYAADNPKYAYFKSRGYRYYCNVDSSQYWVQITGEYLRQGRRNLDGYRMYYNPEMLEDLFNAQEVFDASRPTPVPPM